MRLLPDSHASALSLPNVLTLARIPLAGLLWLAPGHALYFFTLGAIAAVTDMLDGRVARALRARRMARGQRTGGLGEAQAVGAWLDPLCDKIFVMSAVASVYVGWQPPVLVLALICTRELVLIPLMLLYEVLGKPRQQRPLDFRAGPAGKATTVAQFASVAAVITLPSLALPVAAIASVAGLITAAIYTRRGLESLAPPARPERESLAPPARPGRESLAPQARADTGRERKPRASSARAETVRRDAHDQRDGGSASCKPRVAGAERRVPAAQHCA